MDDIILATVIGILIGGRIGEVLLYNRDYYSTHLSEIFAVRHGGMSFIGGIVGVIAAIMILDRIHKLTRKEFFIIFDLILVIVPVGIILGRYGNFLNQELYGIVAPGRLPSFLTHVYPAIDDQVRVNTNLLALLLEGVLIFIISAGMFIRQYVTRRLTPGKIATTFIMLYALIRFGLEYLRADSQGQFIGPFTTTQRGMIFFFIFGFTLRRMASRSKNS